MWQATNGSVLTLRSCTLLRQTQTSAGGCSAALVDVVPPIGSGQARGAGNEIVPVDTSPGGTPPRAAALAFRGRVGRRALARGSYCVTLSARDAAGNAGPATTPRLRVE
jgi:hypothetical protein